MKKIAALFLAGMMLFLAGCSTNSLSYKLPWGEIYDREGFYEKAEYSVLVVDGSVEEGEDGFLATKEGEGKLSFAIKLLGGGIIRIDSKLQITYSDGVESVNSTVEFNNKFEPVYAKKQVVVRDTTINQKTVNLSYTSEVSYGTETKIKLTANNSSGTSETTTSTLSASAVKGAVDNEMLYFATRAISNLNLGTSISFSLFNAYDYVKSGIQKYSLMVACGRESEDLIVPQSVFTRAIVDSEQEANTLPAIRTEVSINSKQNGVPLVLYYSQAPLNYSQSGTNAAYNIDKVLLKMETTEYNVSTRQISQKMIYTLTDYSIVE